MKELVLIMGLPWSGRYQYVIDNLKEFQVITPYKIKEAVEKYTRFDNTGNATVYAVIETITRSLMLMEKPIALISNSLMLETVFIMKKIAVDHDYKLKVVLLDKPIEECFDKADRKSKETLKQLGDLYKKLEQLRIVLGMKEQEILDDFIVVKTEEKKDEVL